MWRKLVVAGVVVVLLIVALGLFGWSRARLPVALTLPPQGAVLDGVSSGAQRSGDPPLWPGSIFRADPTKDLAALQTLEGVVAQGRLYPKATLDAALQAYRQQYVDAWFDDLSMRLTEIAMQQMFDD